MKSDFNRFRFLRKLAIVFVVMAESLLFCCWLYYSVCSGGLIIFLIAIVGFIFLSITGGIIMMAAYDNLLCPRCGQMVVKIKRNLADKENHKRYMAIINGETLKCVYCGAEIKTK